MTTDGRIQRLIEAFASDEYDVGPLVGVKVHNDSIGIAAVHRTATIGTTGQRKKVFYLEAPPRTMGYLIGYLAEPDISRMCEEFSEKVILASREIDLPPTLATAIGTLLKDITALVSLTIPPDLLAGIKDEVRGLLEGCHAAKRSTKVSKKGLVVLNYGVDGLLDVMVGRWRRHAHCHRCHSTANRGSRTPWQGVRWFVVEWGMLSGVSWGATGCLERTYWSSGAVGLR
jgi:hypothetical protein